MTMVQAMCLHYKGIYGNTTKTLKKKNMVLNVAFDSEKLRIIKKEDKESGGEHPKARRNHICLSLSLSLSLFLHGQII